MKYVQRYKRYLCKLWTPLIRKLCHILHMTIDFMPRMTSCTFGRYFHKHRSNNVLHQKCRSFYARDRKYYPQFLCNIGTSIFLKVLENNALFTDRQDEHHSALRAKFERLLTNKNVIEWTKAPQGCFLAIMKIVLNK